MRAAGWKTTNAVIGITHGALERLTRDELQGVIAHEFSHIFNGDMRLNIRLIAVLHGILMIGMLGRMVLRSMRHVRGSRNSRDGRAVLVIFGIGAILMVVGYTGTFFGNWIKSLISRQREYLADASAVQFTRNSDGIANALKKIGGAIPGSALTAASVDEYSHAYFALGYRHAQWFTFSTHPPLTKRIYRIQPNWDGKFLFDERKPVRDTASEQEAKKKREQEKRDKAKYIATAVAAGIPLNEALNALENIGEVSEEQVDAAKLWHQQLPDAVREHAENPYGAQALILALLLNKDSTTEKQQLAVLDEIIGELHTSNVVQVKELMGELIDTQALPLIDLAMPTLREMTPDQYRRFKSGVNKLVSADGRLEPATEPSLRGLGHRQGLGRRHEPRHDREGHLHRDRRRDDERLARGDRLRLGSRGGDPGRLAPLEPGRPERRPP